MAIQHSDTLEVRQMTDQDPDNRLVQAYNQMMHSIKDAFEEADDDTSDSSLQHALHLARERIVELGDLTAEEASQVSDFIKRDINDAAEYLMETSAEFSDWLLLDIEVVERKIVDLFLSVADTTRVELQQLQQQNRTAASYFAGEVTGPGTLQCTGCGKHVPYTTTALIKACEQCGSEEFKRPDVKRLS